MKNAIFFSSFVVTVIELLLISHSSESSSKFQCLEEKGNVPELPKTYSTDVKFNFLNEEMSVQMKYATTNRKRNELIELTRRGRHVKYITNKDEGSSLYIEYQENKNPICKVIRSTDKKDFLRKEDIGKENIFLKVLEVMVDPSEYKIYLTGRNMNSGVYAIRYEGCLREPEINISITFAEKDWKMPHSTSLEKNVNYPEMLEAEFKDNMIIAFYSNFDASEPDNSLFQPPSDVFCQGFRTKKTPPTMPNHFTYSAELINYYRTKSGTLPLISQRKVFYDYNDNISRIDFNDLLASNTEPFTKTTAQKKSIIHDYNSGVQYVIDSLTGKCTIDTFQETFSVISYQQSKNNKMFTGDEFFWLDNTETSYNGQFYLRGITADVYTALRIDPITRMSYIISWFYSAEATQVAENEYVEKNVLLSMSVRPETELLIENTTEIHFFDFVKEEPDVFDFDLTNCYNESTSKTLVFTFPGSNLLRGSEKLVGRLVNIAIKDVTGVRKQRIYTKEVIFSGNYMYAEFSLFENSPRGSLGNETSLKTALQKLQDSVSGGQFEIQVPLETITVFLRPERNGMNVFAGDRPRTTGNEGYHEGSVVALTVGMLLLGLLLGTVIINLIMSRKFGVSLFQRSRFGGNKDHPLNESSM